MANKTLLSLFEIFDNRIFRIPDFQRGYSWGKQQLDEFWEDIQNLSIGKSHYIGQLTVDPISRESVANKERWEEDLWLFDKGGRANYVIDGQQRLTTMIILVNELLQTFNNSYDIVFCKKENWVNHFLFRSLDGYYKSFAFGYEKDNPSDEFFKTRILGQESSSADKYPETLYTANLLNAKQFFAKKLKHLDHGQRESIFDKIENRLKFNYYEIDENLDIHVTFETMNNRGKQLSKLELLKNRLIYLSTLLKEDEGIKNRLRKDINETWKTIYEYLGKNKNNPLDDDKFLANHWIMYFRYDKNHAEAFSRFLLNETFTAKNIIDGTIEIVDIQNYLSSLATSVKQWFYIFNIQYSDYSDDIKEWVNRLNRVGLGAFSPLIMAVFCKEKDQDLISEFLQECESFVFLVFIVTHRQSNTKSNEFYRWASAYYREEFGTEALSSYIRFYTYGDETEQGWFDPVKFKEYVHDLFYKNNQEGFYSWNGLRYFLYEYEEDLQSDLDAKITWDVFNKRNKEDTIEHIYPQTPTDKYWKDRFHELTPKERQLYLNSLGNLLLLSRSKNSKLQNFPFDEKKRRYDNAGNSMGYFNGSYSEIEVSEKDEWTPDAIRERGRKMLEFMEERWAFKFSDWDIEYDDILFPQK